MEFEPALSHARRLVLERIRPGDQAVDATAGNGHDTLFLAEQVGPSGRVYAFDVQEQAIRESKQRLQKANLGDRVELVHAGHETLGSHPVSGLVSAVMFNLGYLPRSDKLCITRPPTTIQALEASLRILRPGGIVTLVCYTGHPGGDEEATAVDEFTRSLPQEDYEVLHYRFTNLANDPPHLIAIAKRGGG